ncbi:MAG: alpha/beta hydrolase [bacterium]|nr:alpha/beta hydrolase [bacterium]
MSTYFFVPGYGRTEHDWDKVCEILHSHGHNTYSITLSNPRSSSLTKHISEVCSRIINEDIQNIILVGHSYAGFVITGVADSLSDRINKLIYVDTLVPKNGNSVMDFFNKAKTKFSKYGVTLFKPLSEPLIFDTLKFKQKNKSYIHCKNSQFIEMLNFIPAYFKQHKEEEYWRYIEIDSDHYCMTKKPNELTEIILQI